jgi:aspartyl-tRNA(Asn)/glutamyl-tRNA(Gln) amidotransferase subunit C
MSLTAADVKKIAHLARLNLSEAETATYASQLSSILEFVEHMNQADTSGIEALSHSIDMTQRLRPDTVSEPNLRNDFQVIAPRVEAGLYLVPKVIEEASE